MFLSAYVAFAMIFEDRFDLPIIFAEDTIHHRVSSAELLTDHGLLEIKGRRFAWFYFDHGSGIFRIAGYLYELRDDHAYHLVGGAAVGSERGYYPGYEEEGKIVFSIIGKDNLEPFYVYEVR